MPACMHVNAATMHVLFTIRLAVCWFVIGNFKMESMHHVDTCGHRRAV